MIDVELEKTVIRKVGEYAAATYNINPDSKSNITGIGLAAVAWAIVYFAVATSLTLTWCFTQWIDAKKEGRTK